MRRLSRLAYGLIAAFLVLYGISMFLPGIVFNTPDILHENPSVGEAIGFLDRGAECWTGEGVHLHLGKDHTLVDERGAKLSDSPPPMACRGQATKTTYLGYRILIDGWLAAFFLIFAWYANVLALVAFVLALTGRSPRTAAWFAGAAFVLGFDTFRLHALPMIGISPNPPETVDYVAIGYYVWEASLLVLLVSQIVTIRNRRVETGPQPVVS